jgi:hypothetical protein
MLWPHSRLAHSVHFRFDPYIIYIHVWLIDCLVQHRVIEPTSDDELLLIGEVEFLQLQLQTAGTRANQNYEKQFLQSLDKKSLQERMKKWQIRKDRLQRLVDNLPAISGEPAVSLAVGEAKPLRRQPDGSRRKRNLRSPQIDIRVEGQPPPVAIERRRKKEAGDAPAPATSGEPAGSPAAGEALPPRRPPNDNERRRKLRPLPIDIKGQPQPVAIERMKKREAGDAPARSRKKSHGPPLPMLQKIKIWPRLRWRKFTSHLPMRVSKGSKNNRTQLCCD